MSEDQELIALALLHRWHTVDLPKTYHKCWRVGALRWKATLGIRRACDGIGAIKRTDFSMFRMWTVRLLWIEAWWARRGR